MSYIQELRTRVGNQPLIMVGATVLIFDQQERLLLMKRSDNGFWGVPGGAMEPGETLEETARRETKEETGLAIDDLTLVGVFSGPELYYCYPNGAQVYNVSVVYKTYTVRGKINLCLAEHTTHQYFDLRRLPEQVSPPIKPILREFVKQYLIEEHYA